MKSSNLNQFPSDETENIVIIFLKLLDVKVNESTVRDTLRSHYSYPSLLSVANAFKQWNIETLALNIQAEQLKEIPVPFLAHINTPGQSFIIINEVNDIYINYIEYPKVQKKVPISEFTKFWQGNILAVETTAESGEDNFNKRLKQEWWNKTRIPLVLATLLTIGIIKLLYFYFFQNPIIGDLLYLTSILICNGLGLIVSVILLWYEYDQNNLKLKKFCSFGKSTDCKDILNSKASKLFGSASWGEVGFVYFTGTFLYFCLASFNTYFFLSIVLFSIVSLPFVFFSIFYQGTIAKKWCVLCLIVQGLLLINFSAGLITGHINLMPLNFIGNIDYKVLITSYFLPLAFWILLKPHFYLSKKANELKYRLSRFKNNYEVFNFVLQNQISLKNNPGDLGILIGNPLAKNSIIKVCNPYCGPCSTAHSKIDKLIKDWDNWNVRIIFNATGNEEEPSFKPVSHLMAIKEFNDELTLRAALDHWYTQNPNDYDLFAKEYPLIGKFEQQKEKVKAMHEWCKNESILFTPTIYINGYRLPEQYDISELHFI